LKPRCRKSFSSRPGCDENLGVDPLDVTHSGFGVPNRPSEYLRNELKSRTAAKPSPLTVGSFAVYETRRCPVREVDVAPERIDEADRVLAALVYCQPATPALPPAALDLRHVVQVHAMSQLRVGRSMLDEAAG
jgi:hypothetical protein